MVEYCFSIEKRKKVNTILCVIFVFNQSSFLNLYVDYVMGQFGPTQLSMVIVTFREPQMNPLVDRVHKAAMLF